MAWLHRREHPVRVLTTDLRLPGVDDPGQEPDVYRELRWYWRDHEFPAIGKLERLRLERHNRRVLQRHLGEFRPDAVMWWSMGGMSLSLIEQVRRAGVPAIGYVGDDWMEYGPRVDAWTRAWTRRRRLGRLAGWLSGIPTRVDPGMAATWHFNSERTLRAALEAGWSLERTEIIPSGIDEDVFRPAAEQQWAWRLLYVGRIDPRKGIATAVDALAHLPPEARLRTVGAGDERFTEWLRLRALELNVELDLAGPIPRQTLAGEYAASDVVVFPVEWEEPWGLVPLEAMAVGRPVVATGSGGSAEYLRDGVNCLLFAGGDARSLSEAVRRLAGDPPLRRRLREKGFTTASRFTERQVNAALERSLHAALGWSDQPSSEGRMATTMN